MTYCCFVLWMPPAAPVFISLLMVYLHAIMATLSEQPALCKLQLSLGDFLCLSDSRCLARVYFWVFHDPLSGFPVHMFLHASDELCSYQGLSTTMLLQPPSSPLHKKNIHLPSLRSATNSFNTFHSPCKKNDLVPFLYRMQSSLRFCNPFSLWAFWLS